MRDLHFEEKKENIKKKVILMEATKIPERVIDTATASSKKFEAVFVEPGQEIE